MSSSPLSTFESSLDELGVSVSHADEASLAWHLDDVVEPPAIGVPLDDALDAPSPSLSETSVDVDPTPAALRRATTGVTGATLGVADYGSVVLSVTDRAGELVSLFVERHVAVVREASIEPGMEAAVRTIAPEIRRTGGSVVLATGPSSTADMGSLVTGAHGPREVHVVVLEAGE